MSTLQELLKAGVVKRCQVEFGKQPYILIGEILYSEEEIEQRIKAIEGTWKDILEIRQKVPKYLKKSRKRSRPFGWMPGWLTIIIELAFFMLISINIAFLGIKAEFTPVIVLLLGIHGGSLLHLYYTRKLDDIKKTLSQYFETDSKDKNLLYAIAFGNEKRAKLEYFKMKLME